MSKYIRGGKSEQINGETKSEEFMIKFSEYMKPKLRIYRGGEMKTVVRVVTK